jgi:hypothetical protein
MDIDSDGIVSPATEGLLLSRVVAGMTGDAVIANALSAGATRNTWGLIRDSVIMQCGMTTVLPWRSHYENPVATVSGGSYI